MPDLSQRLTSALAIRYRIERELGRGGMATVFLAEDLKHHRRVAIKVLEPEVAAAIGPERFLREIETVARLSHPHVLNLHDSGQADGLLYYVMPYVAGESLRQRLERERQLPLEDALRITREVAEALDHAHRQGLVHRDIKPENILLEGGHALVADFGIARAVVAAGGEKLTSTGMVVGTPAYMSPEQAGGGGRLDGRSDQYALACVLYELLAGQPPFTGPTVESLVHQHLSVMPHPVTAVRASVPRAVALALAKALSKTPADRFATTGEFAAALAGSAPVPIPRPRVWALVAAVALVAATAIGVVLWRGSRPQPGPRSLLVLPFRNLTGDPGVQHLCEGLATEIQGDLVRVPHLNVVSHTTASGYRATEKGVKEIARELGVHAVLEGAIQKRGGMIRLDVHLVNGKDGVVTWSGRFERGSDDLMRLEQEVVHDVASTVSGRPLPAAPPELARAPSRSPEAYDAYLQASRYLDLSDDPTAPGRAAELCDRALALDPDFALALAARSKALFRIYNSTKDPDAFRKAEEASQRAIEINPGLMEARLARAQMFRGAGRYAESIEELGEILKVNPNWDEAHRHLAAAYSDAGDLSRAVASARTAIELRPNYWRNWDLLGRNLLRKGDYAEARAAFERVAGLAPELNRGYENLGNMAQLEGKYEEAISAYERLPAPVKSGALASNIATAYFFVRRLDEAQRFYQLAVSLEPHNPKWRHHLGDLYVRRDRADLARVEYVRATRLYEELLALNPEDRELVLRHAVCLAKTGDCVGARRSLVAVLPRLPQDNVELAHIVAWIHGLCGSRDEAIAAVRRTIELGFSPRLIRDEDEFRALAGDPEFIRLTGSGAAGR